MKLLVAAALVACAGSAYAAPAFEFHTPVRDLRLTVAPAITGKLTLSTDRLTFLNTTVGQPSAAQSFQVLNTGVGTLQLTNAPVVTGPFSATTNCGAELASGASCDVTVVFKPTVMGEAQGSVRVASAAGAAQVALTGTGVVAAVGTSPASIELGDVPLGTTSAAGALTVTNLGNLPVSLGTPSIEPPFALAGSDCPSVLNPQALCHLGVTLTPSATGQYSATLSLPTNAGSQNTPVNGEGVAAVLRYESLEGAALSTLAFGETVVSKSRSQSVVLRNTGNRDLHITGAIAVPSPYSVGSNGCASATLSPGASCTVAVNFSPSAAQAYSGASYAMTVPSDAYRAPSLSLTGTGTLTGFELNGAPATAFSYPDTSIGSPSPTMMALSFTNIGTASGGMATPAVSGAHASDFSVFSSCGGVVAGGRCSVTVTFVPTAAGARTASLAAGGYTFSLQGTGVLGESFATFDPAFDSSVWRLSNGNLKLTSTSYTPGAGMRGSLGKSAGKWYWEYTYGSGNAPMYAVVNSSVNMMGAGPATGGTAATGWRAMYGGGALTLFGASLPSSTAYGTPGVSAMRSAGYLPGDIFGFALDMDNKTLQLYYRRAGGNCEGPFVTWTALPASTYYPAVSTGGASYQVTIANFGQNAFACQPPAGFSGLK